ncbi:MAG: hypothetical protein M1837_002559 [Sclerophora amabilis]|nr:MAG: hypothetical protein M1837_002559 [Sclerophora amabilis]
MAYTNGTGTVETARLSPRMDMDDDASSFRSISAQDSDSEDDEVLHAARTSREIASHDRTVLDEEEEREKLLVRKSSSRSLRGIFHGGDDNGSTVRIGKTERRNQKRKNRRDSRREKRRVKRDEMLARKEEDQELMYEMEEGGLKSDASSVSSEGSSEHDRQRLGSMFSQKSRTARCCKFTLLQSAIVVLFVILLLGAYQASRGYRSHNTTRLYSNGTSDFAPTTILISLDGFRADFLNRNLTPTLNSFIEQGISPKYMLPSFPSVTFPNHFTLVTGLYPESHGVVGNTFWDSTFGEEFYYTDPARSMQPKWWQAEPLWVTAENEGVRSAIHMWPGSEAHIAGIEPAYLDRYNGTEVLARKVERILGFLDIPGQGDPMASVDQQRPQFIAAYVPVIDADGHKYGPNSTEIRDTIEGVDDMLHDLFAGLEDRNLTEVVNVVIVSDHGMATTSTDRLIQLDDLINMDTIEHTDGWPLYGLRPKNLGDLEGLYDQLSSEAADNPNFDVYLKDENMPERYHFTNNDRIAPLWIVPKTGWAIVTKEEFDIEKAKEKGDIYQPRGLHGYDHEHPLMRAIFVARGPAFPHTPNSRVEVFQNIEVYNIICDSLSLKPKPNNGTLRLPLKAVGLHSDNQNKPEPEPSDLPSNEDATSTANASGAAVPTKSTDHLSVDEPGLALERPVIEDENAIDEGQKQETQVGDLLGFFSGKFEKLKEWVNKILPGLNVEGANSTNVTISR